MDTVLTNIYICLNMNPFIVYIAMLNAINISGSPVTILFIFLTSTFVRYHEAVYHLNSFLSFSLSRQCYNRQHLSFSSFVGFILFHLLDSETCFLPRLQKLLMEMEDCILVWNLGYLAYAVSNYLCTYLYLFWSVNNTPPLLVFFLSFKIFKVTWRYGYERC